MIKLVTFAKWNHDPKKQTLVTINPTEVSDIEDYCGDVEPGSVVTLKNKKTYLVQGIHDDIVQKLSTKDSTGK